MIRLTCAHVIIHLTGHADEAFDREVSFYKEDHETEQDRVDAAQEAAWQAEEEAEQNAQEDTDDDMNGTTDMEDAERADYVAGERGEQENTLSTSTGVHLDCDSLRF